jgi:hypothetical protein
MAESAKSKKMRKIWMKYAAYFEGSCACVIMSTLDYTQLKRTASQMQRIIHNEKPPQHTLNDPIDDLF